MFCSKSTGLSGHRVSSGFELPGFGVHCGEPKVWCVLIATLMGVRGQG